MTAIAPVIDEKEVIEYLCLSNRATNALINADISTIDKLIEAAKEEWLVPHCIKGLGRKSIVEIFSKLKEYGFLE